ncbi:hypothetical protein ACGF7U_28405 [Micromonospora sp. NPDC047670]|uniref:hypothetical protein n=1 Tax=Micromonospora sp. NPDC047670 TaxID=3364252 RepID=UPI0037151A36
MDYQRVARWRTKNASGILVTVSDGLAFWRKVGIDPIRIETSAGGFLTLRCYFSGSPTFLGSLGRIDVIRTERALARWLAMEGATGHDLARASTWPRIVDRARAGDLEIVVDVGDDPSFGPINNSYSPDFVADRLTQGPCNVDIYDVADARKLLADVAQWAGDDKARRMLADSHPLGRLLSQLSQRTPRMAQAWHPSSRVPPRQAIATEAEQFRELVNDLRARFRVHPEGRS